MLILPCVLHPDRIRGTYPRLKVYSDLKYLPDFLRLENTSAIKSLQKKPITYKSKDLRRALCGDIRHATVAEVYLRISLRTDMHDILYREVSPVNFNSQPKKMHRKQGACISKNALCLLTSKTSVVRDCAARGAAIYGAEGICKFICDIHSETYMHDI